MIHVETFINLDFPFSCSVLCRHQETVEVKDETETNAVEGAEKVKKKKKKETNLEEEKVKEADAEIEDGLKDKKKKKKKKSKSSEAVCLGDDENEKVSKKRKRSEPEEKKEQTGDDEESKRRKKEENVEEDDEGVQETPVKQIEVQENGYVEKSETKSTNQKAGKGLSNSKEVTAFASKDLFLGLWITDVFSTFVHSQRNRFRE